MHRATATALVALTLAACGPGPAPMPEVAFFWQFQDRLGNVFGSLAGDPAGCIGANVDEVNIAILGPAGPFALTVPCIAVTNVAGAIITGIVPGPFTWALEGRRQGMTVFYAAGAGDSATGSFDVRLDADFPNMDLFYELPPGETCTQVAAITFQLDNLTDRVVEYSSRNAFVTCLSASGSGFTMPSIPTGKDYGLRFMAAVNSGGFSIFQACGVGYPPEAPLIQSEPIGNAYTVFLDYSIGRCP